MKALVVIVLFVELISGVIVPPVVSKAKTLPSLSRKNPKEILIDMNLEKSNNIDEKELLQTTADKDNTLNERSFVFINQRFKAPLRNQLYNSQTHNLNKPFTISERLPQVNANPSSSVLRNVSPLKQLFIPNTQIKDTLQPRYGSPSYKHQDQRLKKFRQQKYTLQREQHGVQKPSISRPLDKNSEENLDRKNIDINSEDIMKHYESDIPAVSSYARHRINYNYGFPAFQMHGSINRNNELPYKPNLSMEGSLVADNIGNLSPLDLKDEDQLLERYIKETLEEFNSSDIIVNEHKKCEICLKEGKTDANLKCKGHKTNDLKNKQTVHLPQHVHITQHMNQYDHKKALEIAASNENDRLCVYGDEKTFDDASFNDNNNIDVI